MEPLTFIIEYRSPTQPTPLFLIWHPGEKDQLLTFRTGEIFATDTLVAIQKVVSDHIDELNAYDGLLGSIGTESDILALNDSHQALCDENYSPVVLKAVTDFINLFGNYVEQDTANGHLYNVWRNRHLCEVSDYFYEISLADGTATKPLVVDKMGLVDGLEVMMRKFEECVRVVAYNP